MNQGERGKDFEEGMMGKRENYMGRIEEKEGR